VTPFPGIQLAHRGEIRMRVHTTAAAVFALGLTVSPAAFAQTRVHHTGAVPGAVHLAPRPGTQQRLATTTGGHARVIVLSPATTFNFDDILGNFPVPGLVFDYAHLAAVNSGAGVRALIDPVTQQELALARAIRRETPASFAAFPGFFPVAGTAGTEPTIIVVPQPAAPAAQSAEVIRVRDEDERVAPPRPVEPARDAGDFVLVRRDGGLLFAVAFTQGTERITYVTKESVRHSLPLAELDIDATVRMNEERGTPLPFLESLRR
jgi:hypothetical protein